MAGRDLTIPALQVSPLHRDPLLPDHSAQDLPGRRLYCRCAEAPAPLPHAAHTSPK